MTTAAAYKQEYGVRDTSLAAFFKEKTQTQISTLEAAVLDSINIDGPCTRLDLSERLAKPINCITKPVLNLVKAGILYESHKVRQKTGNTAWVLSIKEIDHA
jgi:predicted transcriptional regulator